MTPTELDAAIEAAKAQRREAAELWTAGEGEAVAVVLAIALEERLREEKANTP